MTNTYLSVDQIRSELESARLPTSALEVGLLDTIRRIRHDHPGRVLKRWSPAHDRYEYHIEVLMALREHRATQQASALAIVQPPPPSRTLAQRVADACRDVPVRDLTQTRVECTIGPVSLPGVLVVDGDAWLTQAEIGSLFGINKSNVSRHISDILEDGELKADSVVAQFATTARDGKSYNTAHYSSAMVLAVGYRVRSDRGVLFRQWVTSVLRGEAPVPAAVEAQHASTAALATAISELAIVVQQVGTILTEMRAEVTALRSDVDALRAPRPLPPIPSVPVAPPVAPRLAVVPIRRVAEGVSGAAASDEPYYSASEYASANHIRDVGHLGSKASKLCRLRNRRIVIPPGAPRRYPVTVLREAANMLK